jgi:hypothetical protein
VGAFIVYLSFIVSDNMHPLLSRLLTSVLYMI